MTVEVVGERNRVATRAINAEAAALRARWRPARRDRDRVLVRARGGSPGAPSAELLRLLREVGLAPVVMRAQDNSPASPRSARLSVLIGPDHMPATAGDRRIDAEIEWARRTDQAGTPILGIGLGARVLASALGGGVEPTDHGHRGWTFLDTSVPHFIAGGPWLTWQHGTIRLPPDAELLAHNRHGPQAFRAGRHLGLRFAPEASQDQAAAWRAADDGSVEYHDTLTATRRDPSAARECARRLILKFLETTTS